MRYLNKKDLVLMSYFRHNARENLTRISRLTSIPVSTIFGKLREYEKSLICKYVALVDFKKLGFDIRMHMLFKVPKETREKFKDFLVNYQSINSIYRINNGFDFMIEGIFKDMLELQHFIDALEKFDIQERQEVFILEDLKREGFLADRLQADILTL